MANHQAINTWENYFGQVVVITEKIHEDFNKLCQLQVMKERLMNTLNTRKQSNTAVDDVQLDLNTVLADISDVKQAISYGLSSVAQLKTNIVQQFPHLA